MLHSSNFKIYEYPSGNPNINGYNHYINFTFYVQFNFFPVVLGLESFSNLPTSIKSVNIEEYNKTAELMFI